MLGRSLLERGEEGFQRFGPVERGAPAGTAIGGPAMSRFRSYALLAAMLSLAGCGGGDQYPRSTAGGASSPPVARQALPEQPRAATPAGSALPGARIRQASRSDFSLASGTPAFNAVRPGDVIEVRFFRNTPLEAERYDLGVGDVVAIDVFEFPELSRERVIVLPDGFISVPLVGSLRAAGKTVDQMTFEIAQRLEAEQILDPQVSVAVVETDPRREALLNPAGDQPTSQITVSEAGFLNLPYIAPLSVTNLPLADLQTRVRDAYRDEFGGRVEVTTNLVSRATPFVFVMGEVTSPSGVELTGPFNPLMAIAAAGGFTPRAEPEEVRVVRVRSDGSYQQFPFNLEAGLEGSSNAGANFRLSPQDVVYVPPSGIANINTWIDLWIRQNIPISFGTGFSLN